MTFQAHDLTHFLLPDLIFTGTNGSLSRRLYIIYRMLSEAITLVFADMLFVEALRREGLEYDWEKRKIWPVFRDCGLDPFEPSEPQQLLSVFRTLLEANIAYCLMGEDVKYRELMSKHLGTPLAEVPPALQSFKDKYMPFFVEDFRWTSQNYACMAEKAPEMSRWWQLAAPIRTIINQDMAGPGASGLQLPPQQRASFSINSYGRHFYARLQRGLTTKDHCGVRPENPCNRDDGWKRPGVGRLRRSVPIAPCAHLS